VIRALLLVGFLAAVAAGEEAPPGEERAAVARVVGEERWGELPEWRQQVILERYARFLRMPPPKRAAIERRGLRAFLLQMRDAEEDRLPPALAGTISRLPPPQRPVAERLAFLRLRQLRLDRSLARLPSAERREIFLRIFPEPFDQAGASAAYEELRRRAAKAFAHALKDDLARRDPPPTPAERRELVRRAIDEEEARITATIGRELGRLEGADRHRARAALDRFLAYDTLRFVTPRQRELIRYAMRPEECPLIDPDLLGPPPDDPAEHRLWERDLRTLARLDLLFEAGFGREMVLHLAGAGSPEELLRAMHALRRPPGRR
jgi:hypothetical protein